MAQHVLQPSSRKVQVMPPVLRGFLWAGVGFLAVNALVATLWPGFGHPWTTEVSLTLGWTAALAGWLLGVGAYEEVVLPLFGIRAPIGEATGWRRYFGFATDHKVVGIQYLTCSAAAFLLAGMIAMAMRLELTSPTLFFFRGSGQYLAAVGVHGTIMMFAVATVALVGGFGNYCVPLMIGAQTTVFPRLSALGLWLIPAGVLTVAMSPLLGYWTTGWRGYEPLGSQDPGGILFYYLGVLAMAWSSTLVSLNLVTTIVFCRAPGLTWPRLPMYVWGILTITLLNLLWLPEIQITFILELLDRLVPLNLFNAAGQPLAQLELFWLFGHPEVYVIVVPAFALWNEIIPVMAQKTLYARSWAILGLIVVMLLSGLVWAHHLFTNMRNAEMIPFSFLTEMISVPTGFGFLAALGTLWRSRYRLTTPALLVLMSLFNFLIGGMSGVYLADPPVDLQVHNTMFVVAHFHYTIIGGMIFAWIAACYYWLPKMSGHLYNELWGKLLALWIFLSFNVAYSAMFLVGLEGMNRWVAAYPPYLQSLNGIISVAAWALGAGFLLHAAHIVWAWRKGPPAPDNPWNGRTLEWLTTSPPPPCNFAAVPVVTGNFYVYGTDVPPAATHWDRFQQQRETQHPVSGSAPRLQAATRWGFRLFLAIQLIPFIVLLALRYELMGAYVASQVNQRLGMGEDFFMLCSLVSLWRALAALPRQASASINRRLHCSLGLGILYLALLTCDGIHRAVPVGTPYGGLFYTTLGISFGYTVIGLFVLTATVVRIRRGAIPGHDPWPIQAAIWYWLFQGAVAMATNLDFHWL